ncbi:MAG: SO_0444 family Cu/Zn efflux transporter [Deltaproteobacteria bacterium]|jgi:uncharacterized protein|nr:SO_0444 family Cu/Zn efflux transporter [Deltaproteobacteria bacterium]
MEIIKGIAIASLNLFNEMSPYLLFGFFFAGILHVLFSLETFARHLGKSNFASVVKAVVFGIPLPLCSCGVIPAAVLLRKKGASRGAVLSFLVATPITGIDSILATYSLLGLVFTIFRVVASSVTALITGILANFIFPTESASMHVHNYPPEENDPECCFEEAEKKDKSFFEKISELFKYAFIELLGDVWKWLVVGIVIGGMISYFIPEAFIEQHLGSGWQAMLIMLVVGIPMYICATGSIPIAAALMLKGLSPGAALVFLLAGPATNAVTFTVVSKELGRKSAILYVVCIAVMSVIMGMILNSVWSHIGGLIPNAIHHAQLLPKWLEIASSILLAVLILITVIRGIAAKLRNDSKHHCNSCHH